MAALDERKKGTNHTTMKDLINRVLFEGYSSMGIKMMDVFSCMLITVLIALYIFVVYRFVNRKAFYNVSFHLSLLVIAVITAAIILTIQTSIVVSLGMVGALSIVRFRTAIKDPMDLAFLFWTISVGIICGAGYALIAIVASIVITFMIAFVRILPIGKGQEVLIVNSTSYDDETQIMETVKKYCSLHSVKARNLTKDHIDLAIEIRTTKGLELVRALMKMSKVTSASIVAHDGEVTF